MKVFAIFVCAFASAQSASSLYQKMMEAYAGGFYPGSASYAEKILNQSGQNHLKSGAVLVYAESLFKMGQFEQALKSLEQFEKFGGQSKELNARFFYDRARILSALGKNGGACEDFSRSIEIQNELKNGGKEKSCFDENLYAKSVYYFALACQSEKNFAAASDGFEFVVQNGRLFSPEEFNDAAVRLLPCLNSSNQSRKAEKYGGQFKNAGLEENTKYQIMLSYGETLEILGEYARSYDVYCDVLENAPEKFKIPAMKKAYSVSSAHQKEVKAEPGKIFEKVQDSLGADSGQIAEFWILLGTDAFEEKDYKKAAEYFNNAKKSGSENLDLLADIYIVEIEFRAEKNQRAAAQIAAQKLAELSRTPGIEKNAYRKNLEASLCKFYVLSENWKSALETAENALKDGGSGALREDFVYFAAVSAFNAGDIQKAENLLNLSQSEKDEFLFLKAKILAEKGNLSDANGIFYSLLQKNALSDDGKLDYAKSLLKGGHYVSAEEIAGQTGGAEAEYLKGLSHFNRRNWSAAEESFKNSLQEKSCGEKYESYAEFYLGYSQYQLEKFEDAVLNFANFIQNGNVGSLKWNACVIASRSAFACGKNSEAVSFAERSLKEAKTEKEKQESVLLCASVFSDLKEYDLAAAVLEPYVSQKTEFGFQCRYIQAGLYVQKKDFESAGRQYEILSKEKRAKSLAEEASYRRGELSFSTGNFEKAAELFESYIKNYSDGKFYFDSMYYLAQSFLNMGRTENAIFYFQQIVSAENKSTYRYGAFKELVDIYGEKEDYGAAVSTAKKMLSEYGVQAENDGIDIRLRELQAKSKNDGDVVLIEEQFHSAGSEKTAEGRKIGASLMEIYSQSAKYYGKGENLGARLLAAFNSDEESLTAAQSALSLAQIYRNSGKNGEAAETFLVSSREFRKCGKTEETARALYGAAESFDAAGLSQDAKSTGELLKKLYPDSKYAKSVEVFIK